MTGIAACSHRRGRRFWQRVTGSIVPKRRQFRTKSSMSETPSLHNATPPRRRTADIVAALGGALDRAGRHDGRRQVVGRPPAGGAARPALRRCRHRDRGGGRHDDPGDFRAAWRAVFPRRRGARDRAPARRRAAGAGDRRRRLHESRRPALRSAARRSRSGCKADFDVLMTPGQAPRRPAAAADRRSGRDAEAADRASAIRSTREADLTVESRDVPHEIIVDEMHRRACAAVLARRGDRPRPTESVVMTAPLAPVRSDRRRRRARRPRLRHRDRPRRCWRRSGARIAALAAGRAGRDRHRRDRGAHASRWPAEASLARGRHRVEPRDRAGGRGLEELCRSSSRSARR